MSFKSPKTPAVIATTPATSPKYNLAGVENELNAMKNRNGYLSTFFGRSTGGVASQYSMRNRKSVSSIFSGNRTE